MVIESAHKEKGLKQQGFTLVELLVVMVIMSMIFAVVLFNHREFQYESELKNIAYDVALDVREMQVKGISASETTIASGEFSKAYGIHFELGTTYTSYADTSGGGHDDRWYDTVPVCASASLLVECINEVTLKTGYLVTDICLTNTLDVTTCSHSDLDVSFKRPNPDAEIHLIQGDVSYSSGKVIMTSPKGSTTSVNMTQSGQIFIQ